MSDQDVDCCTHCGKDKPDVDRRYSFGIYAGLMCGRCAYDTYRDHCGLREVSPGRFVEDGGQGDVTTLHEFEAGGWDAIYGEEG